MMRRLSRRSLLAATGASSLLVPLLHQEQSFGQAGAFPLRLVFLIWGNGTIEDAFWPTGGERDFAFNPTLAPLEPLRKHVQVLKGLDHANANGGADGGGDHARGNGVFLTGVRLNKSATDIRAGISFDQVLAREYGHLTRFPSLELTCDSVPKTGGCDSGYSCAYQFNISWSSATTPKSAESNPRHVFERLFGAGKPGERQANAARRRQEDQSVLDFVLDDARAMQKRSDFMVSETPRKRSCW